MRCGLFADCEMGIERLRLLCTLDEPAGRAGDTFVLKSCRGCRGLSTQGSVPPGQGVHIPVWPGPLGVGEPSPWLMD